MSNAKTPPGLKGGVAISLGAVFALLCAFHIGGAFGVWHLPILPTMPDRPPDLPPPQASSFAWLTVAAALALAVLVVLARGDLLLTSVPPKLSTLACSALGVIFVLRAIGEFRMLGFFKSIKGTDFAFWDTWLYTPLSLALGLGALWLATTPRVFDQRTRVVGSERAC